MVPVKRNGSCRTTAKCWRSAVRSCSRRSTPSTQDLAGGDVVEAHHQAGEGGFACAGVADDGDGLAGLDGEGDVFENPLDVGEMRQVCASGWRRRRDATAACCSGVEFLIGEPDVAEFDAVDAVARDGMGGLDDLRRGVEQLEDALAGGHGGLQDVVFVAEVLDGPPEALRVLDEGMASMPMVTDAVRGRRSRRAR